MSFLLARTSAVVGVVGLSLSLSPLSPFRSAPMQCQYSTSIPDSYRPESQASPDAAWAVDLKQGATKPRSHSGWLTASTMRQMSLGSVLGLVVGVGLRAFSRVLVVLLGMGVVFVEWAAAKGYNIIPVDRLQRLVKGVNVRKAVSQHRPFKITFGATMALAAFAQF
ncbi:hypothetical protein BDV26DRAFT_255504 [Aspergillus bertholletiae]|uniref:FUN14 family-domain-containing protein n=1 Tax=Aspergillus bertholletiae TaxID=1226010 RepID=A0A5N7BHW6_9EURO|nr:hypothetical protein BDV26DRAFT_255504 [Aspergillus bertholletiae]